MKKETFYSYNRGSLKVLPERIKYAINLLTSKNVFAEKYLDIGCADGKITKIIGKIVKAKKVYGVDISPQLVKQANSRGIKAYVVDVDSSPLPFKSNHFDLVTMFELIEHLFDPDFVLKEVWRTLKTDGYFLISTPNLSYWINRILFFFGYKPYGIELSTKFVLGEPGGIKRIKLAGHIRVFTLKALVQILSVYKFKLQKIVGVPLITDNKVLLLFDSMLRSITPSFAQIVLILANKIG